MGVRERLAESKARLKQKEQEQAAVLGEDAAGPEKSGEQAAADLAAGILDNLMTRAQKQGEAILSKSPPEAAKPKEGRKQQEAVSWEDVKARCGHVVGFPLFPEGKDKHREARRKKLTDHDCPSCRKVNQAAREAADRAARQERLKNNPPKEFGYKKLERLPDGAAFDVKYHADEQTWKGRLLIPDPEEPGDFLRFYDEAGAVFKLLSKLDAKWRAWLRDRQQETLETRVQNNS